MSPLIYVDHSTIRAGKLDEARQAIAELTQFIEANEPQLVSYSVFLDGDRMTVIHVHRDRASLQTHMEVAGPRFAKFADLVRLDSIDVYGDPNAATIERLRDKAQQLGGARVTVHPLHRGFVR